MRWGSRGGVMRTLFLQNIIKEFPELMNKLTRIITLTESCVKLPLDAHNVLLDIGAAGVALPGAGQLGSDRWTGWKTVSVGIWMQGFKSVMLCVLRPNSELALELRDALKGRAELILNER